MKAQFIIHESYPGEAHEKSEELIKAFTAQLEGASSHHLAESSVFQAERELNSSSEAIFRDQMDKLMTDLSKLIIRRAR